MISICTLIIIAIILFILNCIKNYINIWQYIEKFPGPFAYPIVGNTLQIGLTPQEYLQTLLKWVKQFNFNTYRVWNGPNYYIIVSDPNEVEAVLSSTTLLNKGSIYEFLNQWLGKGLLTSTGSKWFKHRKMITPSFHFQILPEFLNVINASTDKFINILKVNAKNGKDFDIQNVVHKLTFDIICEATMGAAINSLDNDSSEIVDAFYTICTCITERVFSPIKQTNFGYSFTKDYCKEKKSLDFLKKYITHVITSRRNILQNNNNIEDKLNDEFIGKTKKAFLDNLLTSTIDGQHLTDNEIFEEVSTFMFEGHDTTASAISFAIYNLSLYPDIQDKIYKEQLNIFDNKLDRNPTYQELADMKYLEQFIKETLRMYPSVPLIVRSNTKLIELGGKKVPPNTNIVIFLIAMGYNEKYFKDPEKVIPERYDLTNREGANPFDSVSFSAGPRNCIGQKFAMMELKSTLSKLIRNFEIMPPENAENGKPVMQAVITLKSENGINIRLKNRNDKN